MPSEVPATQQAWVAVRKGLPSVALEFRTDYPVPTQLTEGEVLVKVQAAALNPVGYKLLKMLPQFVARRPSIPEHDLAGIIVDANCTEFKNGDPVFGYISTRLNIQTKQGALCQYTRLPSVHLVSRPDSITPTQASAITLAAQTAYQALHKLGQIQPEQSVFINGGSSAVGGYSIMLAKVHGCKVTTSASGKNEAFVRGLGADEFIDYTREPLHKALSRSPPSTKYHVFFDAVGLADCSLYTHSPAYLAPGGIFISSGPEPKELSLAEIGKAFSTIWNIALRPTWLGGTNRRYKIVTLLHSKKDLVTLRDLLENQSDMFKPIIDSTYEFKDVLKAYERMMSGRATGKVVVKVEEGVD